mmetsp:Transcript_37916/g.88545  ORF Transcript_37916/g.88545 Transcript_37916/m.88545 type:complete len:257 (-) Transcript_37916:465-1235(-)
MILSLRNWPMSNAANSPQSFVPVEAAGAGFVSLSGWWYWGLGSFPTHSSTDPPQGTRFSVPSTILATHFLTWSSPAPSSTTTMQYPLRCTTFDMYSNTTLGSKGTALSRQTSADPDARTAWRHMLPDPSLQMPMPFWTLLAAKSTLSMASTAPWTIVSNPMHLSMKGKLFSIDFGVMITDSFIFRATAPIWMACASLHASTLPRRKSMLTPLSSSTFSTLSTSHWSVEYPSTDPPSLWMCSTVSCVSSSQSLAASS